MQTKRDKLVTMENDINFRAAMFQKVFGTDAGKQVFNYLERLYAPSVPSFQPNVDYYMLGKYRVIQEMKTLLQKPLKKKGQTDE